LAVYLIEQADKCPQYASTIGCPWAPLHDADSFKTASGDLEASLRMKLRKATRRQKKTSSPKKSKAMSSTKSV